MAKKSKEILYESDDEKEIAEQIDNEMPQNINIVAPKPIKAIKAIKAIKIPQIKEKEIPQIKEKEIFKCELCNKQFIRNYYLNRHIDEGRCNVKRNIDLAKQKQFEENEKILLEKILKKTLKVKKQAKPKKQPQIQQPQRPPTPPPQIQQPRLKYIINF